MSEVANFRPPDVDALAQDTRVICYRRKLEAIVGNARASQDLDQEKRSFRNYRQAVGALFIR